MTALEKYDAMIQRVDKINRDAEQRKREAVSFEKAILRELGLVFIHDKEPGDATWTHDAFDGFCKTPREVLVCMERDLKKTSMDSARL